jgi:hypothetical protein
LVIAGLDDLGVGDGVGLGFSGDDHEFFQGVHFDGEGLGVACLGEARVPRAMVPMRASFLIMFFIFVTSCGFGVSQPLRFRG